MDVMGWMKGALYASSPYMDQWNRPIWLPIYGCDGIEEGKLTLHGSFTIFSIYSCDRTDEWNTIWLDAIYGCDGMGEDTYYMALHLWM